MKKYLFIIATAALFASCAEQDTFKKDILTGDGEAISFQSFASKQTRAAENSGASYDWDLFDHQTTFEVWGFKNTSETAVFDKDVVTIGGTTGAYTYTYSPLRYWDKAAVMYEFYAAAPSGTKGSWTFERNNLVAADITDDTKQDIGYFTTSSALNATNITVTTGEHPYEYVNSFKSSEDNADVDKLIAAPKTVAKNAFNQVIQLDFIHILSRLNVTIKKDASLDGTAIANSELKANTQKVILKDLRVVKLFSEGDFTEWTATHAAVPTGSYDRWNNRDDQDVPYVSVATSSNNTEVTKDERYVLQSLVIPQPAAFENVALNGEASNAILYANVDEYNEANGLTGEAAKTSDWWTTTATESDKTKVPAMIAVATTTNPYLKITYTIQQITDKDGNNLTGTDLKDPEEFTAYYNLAAAFGMDGVDHSSETNGIDETELAFYEGWQNTLNIIIKPAEIQFSAKVAEWSTFEEEDLTVN